MLKQLFRLSILLCILSTSTILPKRRHKIRAVRDCTSETAILSEAQLPIPGKPITILVHGTRLPAPLMLFIPGLARQVLTPPGLHPVSMVGWTYHFTRMASSLVKADIKQFPPENFYLFGWSGTLSNEERSKAGKHLYQYLRSLRNDKRFAQETITVIGISHGANVVINIALGALEAQDTTLAIDRIVLLCCPVQECNQYLINSPIFKRVFHIYSAYDCIQILDPQGLCWPKRANYPFFSKRVFATQAAKITQAEVRWAKRATLSHVDFALPAFLKRLPALIRFLESDNKRKLPKNDAGAYLIKLYHDTK